MEKGDVCMYVKAKASDALNMSQALISVTVDALGWSHAWQQSE